MPCNLNSTTCYQVPGNESVGLDGMLRYVQNATYQAGQNGSLPAGMDVVGANLVGLAIILPLFFIIFLIFSRQNPIHAFTIASTVCLIVSFPLVMLVYLNPIAIGLLLGMTAAGMGMSFWSGRY